MVSSTAAAEETNARTSRLRRKIGFIGRTLCTNAARVESTYGASSSGCLSSVGQDRLGNGAIVLADDVGARPRQGVHQAGAELETEGGFPLRFSIEAENLLACELLDLGHHRAILRG